MKDLELQVRYDSQPWVISQSYKCKIPNVFLKVLVLLGMYFCLLYRDSLALVQDRRLRFAHAFMVLRATGSLITS